MTAIRLPYTVEDRDRHGNARIYFRRAGCPKVRLRGLPGSAEFMAAYQAALDGVSGTERQGPARRGIAAPGSFRALCIRYYASAAFRSLDDSTKAWRRRALDAVCRDHGCKPVSMMQRKHVARLRDEIAAKPGAANSRLKAIKALFAWALDTDEIAHNPARDVRSIRYAVQGHHSWTAEDIAVFEARHPLGSNARLAMALLLFTAGRREDAVRLGPQHVKDGRLRFVQAKNEHRKPVQVDIPVHPNLAAAICALPSRHLTFLITEHGKPFTAAGFGNRFREWCDQAGLPNCSAHGLRKAMATRLAEGAATPHEIMSVTGHRTLSEVENYTRAAEKAGLADRAMAKLSRSSG